MVQAKNRLGLFSRRGEVEEIRRCLCTLKPVSHLALLDSRHLVLTTASQGVISPCYRSESGQSEYLGAWPGGSFDKLNC